MSSHPTETPVPARKPVSLTTLQAMHGRGGKIAMLTCYDSAYARLLDLVGIDSILRARAGLRHAGDSGVRTLACAEQFRAMAYAQLTWRESLRDIEASLSANATKLYAMGFRSAPRRSTLGRGGEGVRRPGSCSTPGARVRNARCGAAGWRRARRHQVHRGS